MTNSTNCRHVKDIPIEKIHSARITFELRLCIRDRKGSKKTVRKATQSSSRNLKSSAANVQQNSLVRRHIVFATRNCAFTTNERESKTIKALGRNRGRNGHSQSDPLRCLLSSPMVPIFGVGVTDRKMRDDFNSNRPVHFPSAIRHHVPI